MQQILAFTRKELQLWAKKPGSWIIVFIIPLIFIWIIQSVFGSNGSPVVTIFAVNLDNGSQGARVIEALQGSSNLKIDELTTREEAEKRVSAGEHMAAVIIPKNFDTAISTSNGATVEILIDPARSDQASIVSGLVNAALGPLMIDAEVNRGVEAGIAQVIQSFPTSTPQPGPTSVATPVPGSLQKFFTAALKGVVSSQVEQALADPQVSIAARPLSEAPLSYMPLEATPLAETTLQSSTPQSPTSTASTTETALASAAAAAAAAGATPGAPSTPATLQKTHMPSLLDYLVPGYSLMFVFFLISNLSMTVIEERETGALRRLLVAPIPLSRILMGKMLPYFLIAVVQFIWVLLASRLIFGINLGNAILGLGIIILASSLAMATLGILIAAFARSESQASGLATVLVLAMAVVSGAMYPSISIPGLQAITPHYWAMQGFLNIIARGQGTQGAMLPAGILIIMSAVFFTVGAIRFRFE
jgi:ABC-2 type transport system permease protein